MSFFRSDHFYGPEGTSLVLLEYGDYECPYCAQAHEVVKKLKETFKDELRFIYRNFPLAEIHPNAMIAARASEAAALQGKFWEMHDLLFENQDHLDEEALLAYAERLNLDLERFTEDLVSSGVEQKILSDLMLGERSGVEGTPTFFINGVRYTGDWSYDSLGRVLYEMGMAKAG